MIDELLTLARTDAEIDETDMESVSLESAVAEAWETAETGGATLDTDIPPEWTVDAAPTLVQHIFENLFRNAADHNESPVTVIVGTIDGDGFYVEDDGVGIPEAKRDEVLDYGYTTDHQGTGFGLSIVQGLVEAHDWTIHIMESAEGGARFEVTGVNSDQ
ncbi:MAG: sensor histidine kinase [archaeon]